MFKSSPKRAYEYRLRCLGTEIPEEFRETPITEESKETIDTITPKEEKEVLEVKELDIEVLRAEYLEKFGKKANHMMKAENILKKIEQA